MCAVSVMGSAMKVWIACFILFFGATEVLQWVQQSSLPLPLLVLSGALLAIASNYDKLTNFPFHLDYKKSEALQDDLTAAQVSSQTKTLVQNDLAPQRDRSKSETISFTINKLHQPGD